MKDEICRGDILITSEAPFGQILYWNSDEKIVLSQRIFGLRTNDLINPLYLYYFMTTSVFQKELDARSTGTTVVGLRQPELMKCKVSVPSLPTQQKIAAILSSLDDKIELKNKINESLEQQAQALFRSFSEKASESGKFTDLIDILGGGTPKTNNEDFWNGNIPFFTPKDVGNSYCLTTEKTITEDGLNNCNSKLYPVNTIFVTARGTVGKVSLAGVPMAMNQSCYALKTKDNNQLLVYYYTLEAISSLKHKANGATFDAIVTRDFETETISILSQTDSEKFTQFAESVYKQILVKQQENLQLYQLRDTLLPKFMNGEIGVGEVII